MARTINEIQEQIINQVQADATLSTRLTSTSKVAIWRLWTYVVAVCTWSLENLFDLFKADVDETISAMKPHSLRWYALKAKAFQYGHDLVDETDYYDNTGLSDTAIEASKVVDYAAVVEQQRGLRIKVAKDTGTDLAPLSTPELDAFKEYMKQVKDAGVKLNITTAVADALVGQVHIYYNPLVLNAQGGRNDGVSANPVLDAFKQYLKNLPFNGVFVLQNLVDVLQQVEGVKIVDIKRMEATYGVLSYTSFSVQYIPDSGYLRIYDDVFMELEFFQYS